MRYALAIAMALLFGAAASWSAAPDLPATDLPTRDLPPGEPPPLPEPGPLAEPRSQDQVGLPAELTKEAIPPASPLTPEAVALGKKLFFEPRLSGDGTVSCATCHDPARAFTDGRPTSVGIKGRVGQRNAPTVLDALYNKTQFWDGRVTTLEQQAALPITNPFEMGSASLTGALASIADDKDYQDAFKAAFGRGMNEHDLVRAIATYERTLVSFDSPFDRFIAGDQGAISDSARRGWELFNTKARCNKCHAADEKVRDPTVFTDNDFHNIGIGILKHHVVPLVQETERELVQGLLPAIDTKAIESELSALGRFLITRKEPDIAAFKTPDIRNILVTGPYFHDGSQETLWDIIDHYNHGDGVTNPWLDEDTAPLALTEPEIDDLVAFMASLTSPEYKDQADKEYARQLALSKVKRPQRDTARAFAPKPPLPPPPKF